MRYIYIIHFENFKFLSKAACSKLIQLLFSNDSLEYGVQN